MADAYSPDDPTQKSVLDHIASGEAHDYNTIYGGQRFSSMADHPRVEVPLPNGKETGAAGRYQFEPGTWDMEAKKLGLTDFQPLSQDKAAWDLANTTYKQKTGRDLAQDQQAGKTDWSALHGQWSSLPKPGPVPLRPSEPVETPTTSFGRPAQPDLETSIAKASAAGYSPDEISQYLNGKAAQAKAAGYSDAEINNYLGPKVSGYMYPSGGAKDLLSWADDQLKRQPGYDYYAALPLADTPQGRKWAIPEIIRQPMVSLIKAMRESDPNTAKGDFTIEDSFNVAALFAGGDMRGAIPKGMPGRWLGDRVDPNAEPVTPVEPKGTPETMPSHNDLVNARVALANIDPKVPIETSDHMTQTVAAEWADTGKSPAQIVKDAQSDPALLARLRTKPGTAPVSTADPELAARQIDPETFQQYDILQIAKGKINDELDSIYSDPNATISSVQGQARILHEALDAIDAHLEKISPMIDDARATAREAAPSQTVEEPSFKTTPGAIAAEHEAEVGRINAEGAQAAKAGITKGEGQPVIPGGVADRMAEAKAKGLPINEENIPTRQKVSFKDTVDPAIEKMMKEDKEQAVKIAEGSARSPEGIPNQRVAELVYRKASAENDVETLDRLFHGTVMGQERSEHGLQLGASNDDPNADINSIRAAKDIQKLRQEAAAKDAKGGNYAKMETKLKDQAVAAKKAAASPQDRWKAYVDSIRCPT